MEIQVREGVSVPERLKPIVANAPKDNQDADQYLKDLVSRKVITVDDMTFLLESGALQS